LMYLLRLNCTICMNEALKPELNRAIEVIFKGMQERMKFSELENAVIQVAPQLVASINFAELLDAISALAGALPMVAGADLHNIQHLVEMLNAYGFPVSRPFKFEDFVNTVCEITDVDGMPEQLKEIRLAFIEFLRTINVPEDKEVQGPAVHNHTCDGCEMAPIVGARYHCTICKDYDLCQTCEDNGVHDPTHDMMRVRVAERVNNFPGCFSGMMLGAFPLKVSCEFVQEEPVKQQEEVKEEPVTVIAEEIVPIVQVVVEEEVKEDIKPVLKYRKGLHASAVGLVGMENGEPVGADLYKEISWNVVNDGEFDWPLGTRMIFVTGDRILLPFGESAFEVQPIKVGEQGLVSVMLKTPNQPGLFRAEFRLANAHGKFFGERLSVQLGVVL